MTQIDRIKLLIFGDTADKSNDQLITELISMAESRLLTVINNKVVKSGLTALTEIPTDLKWISDEVVIKRFNRIGSEGYKSQSVEGHSINFDTALFDEYAREINEFLESLDGYKSRKGRLIIY